MRVLYVALCSVIVLGVTVASGQIRSRQGRPPGPLRTQVRGQGHPWRIAPEMPPALRLALTAVDHLRYIGTRVIESKSGLNRVQHIEYVETDGVRSRIEFPKESPMHGQVIVETPGERRHYFPGRHELQILPPQKEEAYLRLAQMINRNNVMVNEVQGGYVAGMPTELVSVADKRGDILQRLWIEPRTGMILKRELYQKDGAVQAAFEFTEANLNPNIRPEDFVLNPPGAKIMTPETMLDELIRRQGFQNVRIPPGTPFRLQGSHVQKIGEQRVLVQQYLGSGHRVALYQLKVTVDPGLLAQIARPNVHAYSWQSGGSSFVLVGDLTEAELSDLGRRLGG